eukprot:scaffold2449_cov340-Prasinococcus_capsulatus_cf.AAC.10
MGAPSSFSSSSALPGRGSPCAWPSPGRRSAAPPSDPAATSRVAALAPAAARTGGPVGRGFCTTCVTRAPAPGPAVSGAAVRFLQAHGVARGGFGRTQSMTVRYLERKTSSSYS